MYDGYSIHQRPTQYYCFYFAFVFSCMTIIWIMPTAWHYIYISDNQLRFIFMQKLVFLYGCQTVSNWINNVTAWTYSSATFEYSTIRVSPIGVIFDEAQQHNQQRLIPSNQPTHANEKKNNKQRPNLSANLCAGITGISPEVWLTCKNRSYSIVF